MKKFWGSSILTVILVAIIMGSLGFSYFNYSNQQQQAKNINGHNSLVKKEDAKLTQQDKAHFEKMKNTLEKKKEKFIDSQAAAFVVGSKLVTGRSVREDEQANRTKSEQNFDQLMTLETKNISAVKRRFSEDDTDAKQQLQTIQEQTKLHEAYNTELDKFSGEVKQVLSDMDGMSAEQFSAAAENTGSNLGTVLNVAINYPGTVEGYVANKSGVNLNGGIPGVWAAK
ncbi:hypothetical protein [Latilactobacillus sakei]|uniref:hypothetical protein n=1 Tax=Latilactobacillus sakei TaxID=1599 RepID=UPI003F52F381